jgi:polar amino acid transport system substrate-binding protein
LTIGTDNPAYPPYYAAPSDGKYHSPWNEQGDPYTGQGFESAVSYALAQKLGFAQADVAWTVVPFDNSFAPGAKAFDFYLAQVSYTPERAGAVDLSDGYYFVNQSVVAIKGSPIASAKTVADLKKYKFGAQVGTTAYTTIQNVIAPTTKASVYDSNDNAIAALKAKQIDGLVVDLPTAGFITSVQLDGSVIVGQFPATQGPDAEHFSLVLAKSSPLTTCVNQAIAALKSDGTLDSTTKKWLAFVSAPAFGQ